NLGTRANTIRDDMREGGYAVDGVLAPLQHLAGRGVTWCVPHRDAEDLGNGVPRRVTESDLNRRSDGASSHSRGGLLEELDTPYRGNGVSREAHRTPVRARHLRHHCIRARRRTKRPTPECRD